MKGHNINFSLKQNNYKKKKKKKIDRVPINLERWIDR